MAGDVAPEHRPCLQIPVPCHPPLKGRQTGDQTAGGPNVPAECCGDAVRGCFAVPG
jgi:hypothetical protein